MGRVENVKDEVFNFKIEDGKLDIDIKNLSTAEKLHTLCDLRELETKLMKDIDEEIVNNPMENEDDDGERIVKAMMRLMEISVRQKEQMKNLME